MLTAMRPDKEDCRREEKILREYCESRFPVGDPTSSHEAVTGENYREFGTRGSAGFLSPELARLDLQAIFDNYAASRTGTLYWRVPPEIEGRLLHRPDRWVCIHYMRLLISDKPRIS